MKQYAPSILKALGITVGLNVSIFLLIYFAASIAVLNIGQLALIAGVTLLLLIAVCLYAIIRVKNSRSVWLCLAASIPAHILLTLGSFILYRDLLSGFWPGSDRSPLLFLSLTIAAWTVAILPLSIVRSARANAEKRKKRKQIKCAKKGYTLKADPLTPARGRLLAILKGFLWVLWLHALTGLSFEILSRTVFANTIATYVFFPCLWCFMAIVYGFLDGHNRVAFTLTASLTHLLFSGACVVFLLPATVLQSKTNAVHYINRLLNAPFEKSEEFMLLLLFLAVWMIILIFGIGHRKTDEPAEAEDDHDSQQFSDILFTPDEEAQN